MHNAEVHFNVVFRSEWTLKENSIVEHRARTFLVLSACSLIYVHLLSPISTSLHTDLNSSSIPIVFFSSPVAPGHLSPLLYTYIIPTDRLLVVPLNPKS